jgi:3-oxoacyl-(acyl-carrier-protein) synthase
MTGHLLGAAGAVEAIATLLAVRAELQLPRFSIERDLQVGTHDILRRGGRGYGSAAHYSIVS